MGREVFRKKLSGGPPDSQHIFTAKSGACICSMAFEGQRLYWAQDGVIHSVIPSDDKPPRTHQTRPAVQARNGIGIIGDTAYWIAIDKVYRGPEDAFQSRAVEELVTTNRRLNGLVVVKP